MQVVAECIPCYLRQALNTLRQTKVEDNRAQAKLKELLPLIAKLDSTRTPAENSTLVLRLLYELMGDKDPFAEAKRESNRLALGLIPQMRRLIEKSADPLYTALQVAVAGNIIDMGILPDYDVEASLKEALSSRFERDDYPLFREKLAQARQILILCDNSGEIAFDRLLAEQLRREGAEVICAVKGGPILNDATLEDVREVGLTETAQVITNGSDFLGTVLERCSAEFRRVLAEADLVIGKGQANYESLESTPEAGDKTFFLLRAKCKVVAASLGVNFRALVFTQNQWSR